MISLDSNDVKLPLNGRKFVLARELDESGKIVDEVKRRIMNLQLKKNRHAGHNHGPKKPSG